MRRLGFSSAILAVIGAFSVAACDHQIEPMQDISVQYPITVERRVVFIELNPDGRGGLSPEEVRETESFLADWRDRAPGPLLVSAPHRSKQQALLDTVRRIAGRVQAGSGDFRLSAPTDQPGLAVLAYEKLVAIPPKCQIEEATLYGPRRTQSPAFGCAMQTNLAAMVANPADLVAPSWPSTAAFSARQSVVIEKWRKGKATPAEIPKSEQGIDFLSKLLGGGK